MANIIGEGAYGVIYKPALPCDTKKKYRDTVGKVFENAEAMLTEKYNHEFINKIDPEHKYTVQLYDECSLVDSQKYQLIYKYGGSDMKHLLLSKGSPAKFKRILKSIKPVLMGLQILIKKGYAHMDIKPDNILKKGTNIYLIDFGLTTKTDQLYVPENDYIFNHDYPYYPCEFKLINYNDSFETFYTKYKKSINMEVYLFNTKINIFDQLQITFNINIKQQLFKIYMNFNKDKLDTDKIDLFSLGITLFLFYVWSGIKNDKIKDLIRGMTHFDVTKRFNIKQTIKEYNKIK